MGVGAAQCVDLGDVFRVLGELDDQPVGRRYIDRLAIAVVGFAILFAGAFQALFQLIVSLRLGLEGDVVVTADLGGLFGLGHLVEFGIGELEKGERAAVGHAEEGVAEFDLPLYLRAEVLFAPGRDQRNA